MAMNKQIMKDIIMTKDYALLQTMLKGGWDINGFLPCADNDEPVTALYMATELHDYSMMRELLAAGADIDRIGGKGSNALDSAVIQMRLETVKFLIENGANIHLRGSGISPQTLLDLAIAAYSFKHKISAAMPPIYRSEGKQSSLSVLEYLVTIGIKATRDGINVTTHGGEAFEWITSKVDGSFAEFYTAFQENAVLLQDAASLLGSGSDSAQRRSVRKL